MDKTAGLILDMYASAQHCAVPEFSDLALDSFKQQIPFESAVMTDMAVTAERKLAIHTLHLHALPLERVTARAKLIGEETINADGTISTRDAAFRRAFTGQGRTVITSIETTFYDPDILAYCKKFETSHSMTLMVRRPGSERMSAVSFWRAARKNGFHGGDAAFADRVLPHVLQARDINSRLGMARTAVDKTTLLASLDGRLYFVDDAAIGLLQREWKQWVPPMLPQELMASLRCTGATHYTGKAITAQVKVDDKLLCIVLAAKPERAKQLTAAEHRVALHAARGLPYKEIAALTGVSPATIRNQLHTAYHKLGVTNKTALALALAAT